MIFSHFSTTHKDVIFEKNNLLILMMVIKYLLNQRKIHCTFENKKKK